MVYKAIMINFNLSADLGFSGQFSLAGVSRMSNTAEGFAHETDKEYTNHHADTLTVRYNDSKT